MDAVAGIPSDDKMAAIYDRVVREVRRSYGDSVADDRLVQVAHDAVDELVLRNGATVLAFVPVLALRSIRETISRPEAEIVAAS
ncbi:MAG TPA: hypothetical protein PK691_09865 [Thermomicrobiales bacterium]|nr:hypothetical protein [Thermomicrobiales bacterium]HRA47696.1 hypothetical protein [Thermomicrobiales bacterium]